jgi:hypothetical protein
MSIAPVDVVILRWTAPSQCPPQKIVSFLGVQARCVELAAADLNDVESVSQVVPRCKCLVVDGETLAKAAEAMGDVRGLLGLTSEVAEHVFVYGFQPNERHNAVLDTLSSGSICGVQPLRGRAGFHVVDDRKWCGQFSGLSFGETNPAIDKQFVFGSGGARHDALVLVGDRPFFIRAKLGRCQMFLSACAEVADLDAKVGRQMRVLSWFSRLVPLMMFLRGALGNRVWRNENPRACFIIDDPLLKNDRYGFLEYGRLVESMRRWKFSTSIAFIPWNYRRSRREVAALFSSRNDGPSLCVHGCDHTGGEFAAADMGSLRTKAQIALKRMELHRQLSGVPFDDVMVFPQGLFSAEAMTALKACGYLAAVNSDVFPSTQPESRPLRDLLDVAISGSDDFPLFGRRYPHDPAEFAFDLFMGKPALAVEHHGYFRNGYAALESFVERLNGLDARLEWSDLGTICSRACLARVGADGDVQVRFYTSRFSLTNCEAAARKYCLTRRQTSDGPAPSVTIDGHKCAVQHEDGYLRVNLSLDPGQTADIRTSAGEFDLAGPRRRAWPLHGMKVLLRRRLSEFRDNHLDTNRVLSAIAATART